MKDLTYNDYSEGHPWFYILGGTPMSVNAIKAYVHANGMSGYLEQDIQALDGRAEPRRSEDIKAMRIKTRADLARDIRIYRECVKELKEYRATRPKDAELECEDIHVSLGLKFAHMLNGFGHLRALDALALQKDLFDLI